MQSASPTRGWPQLKGPRNQRGQALIYGIFILVGGLASLFFLFNTGQLQREKTKLVTTTDAVAYSAGLMHARAFNYSAYTNRALMANEVAIAQLVSASSWAQYIASHGQTAETWDCDYYINRADLSGMDNSYPALCMALAYAAEFDVLDAASDVIQEVGEVATDAAEVAKAALKASQIAMVAAMPTERQNLMNDVARANYVGDGVVSVDSIPLADGYLNFEGKPFMKNYSGDDRERFKQAAVTAAYLDKFVESRRWKSTAWSMLCPGISPKFDYMQRAGGTDMVGYDEWRALDTASMWHYTIGSSGKCEANDEEVIAYGGQKAKGSSASGDDSGGPGSSDNPDASDEANNSGSDWNYSGLPNFFDLSDKALAYVPENKSKGGDEAKKLDPKVKFAVRVTRAADQTSTSDARSEIKSTTRLNAYKGVPARGVYVGVAASEVFFMRPDGQKRADGNAELASLFNPYWQAHLVDASDLADAAGIARQGAALPAMP